MDLPPHLDLEIISELYKFFKVHHELEILRSTGSWGKGPIITIRVEKPMSLLTALSKIPAVEAKLALSEEDGVARGFIAHSAKDIKIRRIKLALKAV